MSWTCTRSIEKKAATINYRLCTWYEANMQRSPGASINFPDSIGFSQVTSKVFFDMSIGSEKAPLRLRNWFDWKIWIGMKSSEVKQSFTKNLHLFSVEQLTCFENHVFLTFTQDVRSTLSLLEIAEESGFCKHSTMFNPSKQSTIRRTKWDEMFISYYFHIISKHFTTMRWTWDKNCWDFPCFLPRLVASSWASTVTPSPRRRRTSVRADPQRGFGVGPRVG